METKKWCEHLRVHYAKSCIIPSTLRGQVEKGGSDEARVYIEENVFLDDLAKNHATPETFTNFLDRHTNELKDDLSPKNSARRLMRFPLNWDKRRSHHEEALQRRTNYPCY